MTVYPVWGIHHLNQPVVVVGPRSEHAPLAKVRMSDERDPFLASSLQHLQDNIRRAGPAATAGYTLIGAILLFGGGGALIDRWQSVSPWGLIIGLLIGLVVGFYEVARVVWKP